MMERGELNNRHQLVGESSAMRRVYDEIVLFAARTISVIVRGETGVGKELVAQMLHAKSSRASKPLVVVNCGAIPENLVESELFGHEKGSFTGADRQHIGSFESADKGTLFLDEVGELPLSVQVKLLRVLQDGTFRRIGGRDVIRVDVRVVAATNADLERSIQEQRFREDLYFRLRGVEIDVPPLRKRPDDILPLAEYFLERYAGLEEVKVPKIGEEAIAVLEAYHWPGNVRELAATMHQALVRCQGTEVERSHLGDLAVKAKSSTDTPEAQLCNYVAQMLGDAKEGNLKNAHKSAIECLERELLTQALELTHNNQSKASAILGIRRATLREKLQEYGLL